MILHRFPVLNSPQRVFCRPILSRPRSSSRLIKCGDDISGSVILISCGDTINKVVVCDTSSVQRSSGLFDRGQVISFSARRGMDERHSLVIKECTGYPTRHIPRTTAKREVFSLACS
ncbi:hypothetical protein Hypma_000836 [Hypsizygus marmoreus]|uniref:Uncharacterized protein n=1 Tax=Hypsizygus marmoreus TaxID=39966 RepID=A0A369J074_HYPMA|nr:hypothetical protein Hypma_004545 [Hypsizygus marmoreus]RDB17994.1 hypothetical protein Hypma_000836 [Hypsizygus marmoreus]